MSDPPRPDAPPLAGSPHPLWQPAVAPLGHPAEISGVVCRVEDRADRMVVELEGGARWRVECGPALSESVRRLCPRVGDALSVHVLDGGRLTRGDVPCTLYRVVLRRPGGRARLAYVPETLTEGAAESPEPMTVAPANGALRNLLLGLWRIDLLRRLGCLRGGGELRQVLTGCGWGGADVDGPVSAWVGGLDAERLTQLEVELRGRGR